MTTKKATKWFSNLIVPLLLASLLGWLTWTTQSVYGLQAYKEVSSNQMLEMKNNFTEIRNELSDLNHQIRSNQEKTYNTLLDIQKQIVAKKK